MLSPASKLDSLPHIGPALASQLAVLGILTVEDLIYYFPRAWEDLSQLAEVAHLIPDGQRRTVKATLINLKTFRSPYKRMTLTQGIARDASGELPVIWFNQPFLRNTLKTDTEYFLTGKVENRSGKLSLVAPDFERVSDVPIHSLRIVPVYPETGRLTTKVFRRLCANLAPIIHQIEDYLPDTILAQYHLLPLSEALLHLHFPASLEYLQRAKDRLAFDELLLTQLAVQGVKQFLKSSDALPIPQDIDFIKSILAKLPYQLTIGQKKALWEIVQDLSDTKPTNRLLEGDVGSGKTIVIAIAMMLAAKYHFQSALMAPTEVLAYQHYHSLEPLLTQFGITCRLFTQSFKLGPESADVTIGTHTLIQDATKFDNLNLVIIDEQHRFGVKQREKLKHKSADDQDSQVGKGPARHTASNENAAGPARPTASLGNEAGSTRHIASKDAVGWVPHFLSLTATPIPRSLALTLFGDLDLSVITMRPVGRLPIKTSVITNQQRGQVYKLIQQEIDANRQAFVITPLIADSDRLAVKSAEKEFKNIQSLFPHARVGLLHGRLTTDKKQAVMDDFKNQRLDILVATTVIEVGVDIPNATVMLIEGAERFGLAQLHQLRGRVGRGQAQSYCFVTPTDTNDEITKRLQIFANNVDGFKLAEMDLQMRGPGSLFGKVQSGFVRYRLADWTDAKAIKIAQDAALEILSQSPDLSKYPELKKKVNIESVIAHSE